jgi:hypothetical protein
MTKEERVAEFIDNLPVSDLVALWNEIMEEYTIWDNDDYTINEYFNDEDAYEVLCRTQYGDYDLNHDYFYCNAYGNLVSFNNPKSDVSPISIAELADNIVYNEDDCGYDEIRDILDSEDDFGESINRRNRRRSRRSESIRRNRISNRRMNESIDDSFADSLIGLPYDKAIKKIENAKLYLSEYGISGGGTPAPGKTEYASFQDEDKTVELVIKYKLSKNQKYPNALTNGEIIDAYIY